MQCVQCAEDDPSVIVMCRDGVVRCAYHAIQAGYCADCGEADPQQNDDLMLNGVCFDCQSAIIMYERRHQRRPW